ncbi:MAG TPA: pilus assembly protein TadG-related protein [Chloroflexota bacterium]|nr:pilus assembly protein TadG-related protein [Chloroflexota bacterium]
MLWSKRFEHPRRQRGQMLVLFALAFTAIAAGVGMAADMGLWTVERQRLQTALDAAAIAGARYLVAYAGDPNALSIATAQAQQYLADYGYPAGAFSGAGRSLTVTGDTAARTLTITATWRRPSLLLWLVGYPNLDARATASAVADIKADIYVMIDVTASMSDTDLQNVAIALTDPTRGFINLLGLNPSNPDGPQLAIGRFVGERCARSSLSSNYGYGGQRSPFVMTNWVGLDNWKASPVNPWCDWTNPTLGPRLYSGGTFNPPINYCQKTRPAPDPALPRMTCEQASTGSSPVVIPPDLPGGSSPPNQYWQVNTSTKLTQGIWWNPHYPGATTRYLLGQDSSRALSTVNSITALKNELYSGYGGQNDTNCPSTPQPASSVLDQRPYRGYNSTTGCFRAGTSHVAGLVTAAYELNSPRARATQPGYENYRRVLILQTDGLFCGAGIPFSRAQGEARAVDVANQLKNNPNPYQGIEIFTIMFWNPTSDQSCPSSETDDGMASSGPNCPGPLASANIQSGYGDQYMINLSSSAPGTCDHYYPAAKSDPNSLLNAYRGILTRLAVGKIVS